MMLPLDERERVEAGLELIQLPLLPTRPPFSVDRLLIGNRVDSEEFGYRI